MCINLFDSISCKKNSSQNLSQTLKFKLNQKLPLPSELFIKIWDCKGDLENTEIQVEMSYYRISDPKF